MRRKGKTSGKGRGARLLVAAVALLATLLASCDNLITRTPPADVGGGYAGEVNSAGSGALTVTASVSGGASRHAMPSLEVRDFAYAALLYQDDSDEKGEFAKGDVAGEKTLSFSFPRPESTEKLTIEIFAFKKGTTAFSEDDAILCWSDSGLGPVGADGILNVGTVKLEVKTGCEALGTVSLKVRVPADCTLEISGEYAGKFKCKKDDDDSNTYTISQADEAGITADAYQLTLTVKKEEDLILYVLSEYINVLNGMCTDTWDGCKKGEPREISEASFSSTVYVRGSGGWYDANYADTAKAKDENFGSFLAPLDTIQKAVDKVLAMNDGKSDYTIYVDGALKCDSNTYIGANGMADFSALKNDLNLTIKALSGTATLDAGGLSRVIYAPLTAGSTLTLENLKITGGNTESSGSGGGIYVSKGTLILQSGTISGNIAGNPGGGSGVYLNNGTFIMKGGTIGGSTDDKISANTGGGVYVSGGTFTMSGGEIVGIKANYGGGVYVFSGGTFNMTGGSISDNNATYYGGGVCVAENTVFTMEGGTIFGNEASGTSTTSGGGGVYVNGGTFTMSDTAKISGNTAEKNGGGVYVTESGGTFTMEGGEISGNTSSSDGGGVSVKSGGNFTMEGGEIRENEALYSAGVYLNGSGSTFTMSGGEIVDNNATSANNGGGGVSVGTNNTFTMTGGTIRDNITQGAGGGVFVWGTFNMSGNAKITGNTGVRSGGGIYINGGTVTISGGTISANETTSSGSAYGRGGGIHVLGGTVTMSTGTISGNTAKNSGGGVYVTSSGAFSMTGGTISGNTAKDGKGVYVYSGNIFTMAGGAKVDADNDVYLVSTTSSGGDTTYATITVAVALTAATPVATITPSSYADGTQVLSVGDGVTLTQEICDQFALSDDSWEIKLSGAQGVLKEKLVVYLNSSSGSDTNSGTSASTAVATLTKAIELYDAKGAEMIMVCAAYTLTSGETSLLNRSGGGKSRLTLVRYDGSSDVSDAFTGNLLEISQNATISNVTLDGNKDNISATSGYLLYVSGSSTTVTFGSDAVARNNKTSSSTGSGISIYSGTFKMTDGSLVEENQASYGGGVYVNTSGKFEMSGGIIRGNTATSSSYGGGGVYVRGTGKMSGGEILGNTASKGGGLYVAGTYDGDFTMTGGKITGNTATSQGGGVYVTGTFTMEGGEITGNTAATSGNGVSGTFTHTGGTVQED